MLGNLFENFKVPGIPKSTVGPVKVQFGELEVSEMGIGTWCGIRIEEGRTKERERGIPAAKDLARFGANETRTWWVILVARRSWGNQLLWGYDESMDPEIQQVFNLCVDRGVTLFDTGDSYGTG